jgi:hypothetical protein
MDWWRISKYDPAFRDRNGVYERDEWTSVTDIGRAFDDMTLDLQTYLATEAAYVASVREFMVDANVTTLRVDWLEPPSLIEVLRNYDFPDAPELERLAGDLHDGKEVSGVEIDRVCRLNLRDVLWCRLEDADRFVVETGHEYYLHLGTTAPSQRAVSRTHELGLFVEEWSDPHV